MYLSGTSTLIESCQHKRTCIFNPIPSRHIPLPNQSQGCGTYPNVNGGVYLKSEEMKFGLNSPLFSKLRPSTATWAPFLPRLSAIERPKPWHAALRGQIYSFHERKSHAKRFGAYLGPPNHDHAFASSSISQVFVGTVLLPLQSTTLDFDTRHCTRSRLQTQWSWWEDKETPFYQPGTAFSWIGYSGKESALSSMLDLLKCPDRFHGTHTCEA